MKSALILTVLCAMLAISMGAVRADSCPDNAWPRLNLVNDADYSPYSGPDIPEEGFGNAMVTAVFRAACHKVDIRLLPWSRALALTKAVQADGIAGAYKTPDRQKHFVYSEPFWVVRSILMAKRAFPLRRYRSLDDLRAYRIGVVQDNAAPKGFLDSGLVFDITSTTLSNLRKLRAGRVDIIFDAELRLHTAMMRNGFDRTDYKILSPPLGVNRLHFIVSKKHPNADALIAAFNTGLERIRASGQYRTILKKFAFPLDAVGL